ncbi:hypothetical protein PGT21_023454 [Puccinia graminis f. sp. tritici]|uniref:Uncharacterized protein n=1 Tax=Puccinia graminis f. sp. tritici TaxID=56615 RepID=A0A5B0LYB8_PUCGR|nr:hypothetical protein PGT21_023454 [Puccinia graminis f. sp. tritici]
MRFLMSDPSNPAPHLKLRYKRILWMIAFQRRKFPPELSALNHLHLLLRCRNLNCPHLPLQDRFGMIPADKPPAKEIVGDIDSRNIISGSRQRGGDKPAELNMVAPAVDDPPEELLLLYFDVPDTLYLSETVSIKEALSSLDEHLGWKEAMAKEYHSLASKNTGTVRITSSQLPPEGFLLYYIA